MFRRTLAVLLFVSSFFLLSISLRGVTRLPPTKSPAPEVLKPSAMGVSDTFLSYAKQNAPPLAPLLPLFGTKEKEPQEFEIPNQFYIPRGGGTKGTPNIPTPLPPLAIAPPSTMYNQTVNGLLPVTPLANYIGLGNGFSNWTNQGLLPPDTTMAVGNNQIVQWVNIRLTVLNKTTGAVLTTGLLGGASFVSANQVWSGLGPTSVCATQNQGDPVLQYDRMANRWVLSQFAFHIAAGTSSGAYAAPPYAICVAVSQTNDATGAYNLYEFSVANLPDYPKIGIWTDGLYLTANDFSFSTVNGASTYRGSRVCAFDEAAMIAGTTATGVCFTGLPPTHFANLPADFEGSIAPPANTTEYIVGNDWFTKNNPPYFVLLWRFHSDFVTPGNSTLTDGFGGGFDSAQTMPFDNSVIGACGDGGGICVPQPGTTRKLDTLSMRLMYRAAYRNLGSGRESIVATESVGPTGGAAAGIQLLEIRNVASNPPSIYNNVNFNPDATNRWMGAAATDKLGNIGLGYSVGSATLSPGIRIAGRLRNDIKSTLRGEMNLVTGSGSQTASAQRWGDYSTMQIDPDDDCTFWYTQEYMNNTSGANWATQILSFKFNNCH